MADCRKYVKEVWSNNYGRNPVNGLHAHLFKVVKGYKKSNIQRYLTGFPEYIGQPNKQASPKLASKHFDKWILFVKDITLKAKA